VFVHIRLSFDRIATSSGEGLPNVIVP
jgi:hypothetical protein